MSPLISKRKSSKAPIIIVIVITLVIGGVVFVYFKSRSVADNEAMYGSSTTNPSSNTPTSDPSQTNGSTSSPKGSEESVPTVDSSVTPVTPAGTFVSNHRPSLSGSYSPSQENSTCTTTPGVECYIEFTKDGITKRLAAKKTDSNGNAGWDWDVRTLGLTQGNWNITAVAKNGTKTASATDEILLQVQP